MRSLLFFIGIVILTLFLKKLLSEINFYFIQPVVFGFIPTQGFTSGIFLEEISDIEEWMIPTYDFILVGFIAAGIKIFKGWITVQKESIQLEQDKLMAELQLIKTQMNPGFLFNTLDDLYILSSRQSDLAPGIVLKLSNLLSYLLYESQASEVLLEREIEMIENYIYLMEMHDPSFEISRQFGEIKNGTKIPPLLVLPFLEYISSVRSDGERAWASIHISVSGDDVIKLVFIKGSGIITDTEFENVKKRLNNLYPGRYHLKIMPEEDTVLIKLILEPDPVKNNKTNTTYEPTLLTY